MSITALQTRVHTPSVLNVSPCLLCGAARSRALMQGMACAQLPSVMHPLGPSAPVLTAAHAIALGPMKSYRLDATNQSWYTQ